MTDKPLDEEIKKKAQESRKIAKYMISTPDLVEKQIREAMDKGDFNNLEGSGKRLHLEENPFEPVELRMVNKILKDNDFAPYWIELGKDIEAAQQRLLREVEDFKRYTQMTFRDKRGKQALERYNLKKANFYSDRRRDLEKISKMILDYNLHCPTFRMGRANLLVDSEMEQIVQVLETLIQELNTVK